MSFGVAIISGIVQGITEFLPISSSGHLVILHKLVGLNKPALVFDIFLHLGTLFSILVVFGRDVLDIIISKRRLGFFILVSTLVTVCFVFIFQPYIETVFNTTKYIGIMFILTGIWLIVGNFVRIGSQGGWSLLKAIFVGVAQGVSTFPGISRSGATIATGLFLGVDARDSAKFSFLLAIPVIIGAFLFKINCEEMSGFNINYLWGAITSCIVGIVSLRLLLKMLFKHRFHIFGLYCILVGILVFIFLPR